MYIIIALITGGCIIVSMIINASLSKRIGIMQGTAINYAVGLVFSIILFSLLGKTELVSMSTITNLPKFYLLGGGLGVIVIMMSNMVIPKIPAAYTTLLLFIGQLAAGIFIDYINLGIFSKGKVIGGVLVLLGLMLDRKASEDGS